MTAQKTRRKPKQQATQSTGPAHFTMHGDDFTRIARQRMLEDAPGHAFRIASCLNADDGKTTVADVALRILQGKTRLVGQDNMRLVDEEFDEAGVAVRADTRAYLEQLAYVYAGRIRRNDRWYRPIAYVADMGPHDLKNDRGKPVKRTRDNRGYTNRAWHYTYEGEIVVDEATYIDDLKIEREVIFAPCGERPHWQVEPSPQDALVEYLKIRGRLEQRGHTLLYGAGEDSYDTPEKYGPDEDPVPGQGPAKWQGTYNKKLGLYASEIDKLEQQGVDLEANAARLQQEERDAVAKQRAINKRFLEKRLFETDPEYLKAEEMKRRHRLFTLRERILEQAGDDLIDFTWPAHEPDENEKELDDAWGVKASGIRRGGTVKIPRAPFLLWAFARLKMYNQFLPTWNAVSPSGMKMAMDDRNHTDWIIGGGFDPEDREIYGATPFNQAAYELSSKFQDEYEDKLFPQKMSEGHPVHVLVTGAAVAGTVVHGRAKTPAPAGSIVVLPNLHPRYVETVIDAAAVITEAGGETAHLAQIGRERSLPIVRIENARELYREGDEVFVNPEARRIETTWRAP